MLAPKRRGRKENSHEFLFGFRSRASAWFRRMCISQSLALCYEEIAAEETFKYQMLSDVRGSMERRFSTARSFIRW